MLTWIKSLFAGAGNGANEQNFDFSPKGKHSFTAGGTEVIDRPYASEDTYADAFEIRLLNWIQFNLKVKPVSHFGTNTLYWKFDFNGSPVELAVIGQSKNTGMTIADELEWILRVEEFEPLQFIPVLEKHFANVKRVKRKLDDAGKVRIQFKSLELLGNSQLNYKK